MLKSVTFYVFFEHNFLLPLQQFVAKPFVQFKECNNETLTEYTMKKTVKFNYSIIWILVLPVIKRKSYQFIVEILNITVFICDTNLLCNIRMELHRPHISYSVAIFKHNWLLLLIMRFIVIHIVSIKAYYPKHLVSQSFIYLIQR